MLGPKAPVAHPVQHTLGHVTALRELTQLADRLWIASPLEAAACDALDAALERRRERRRAGRSAEGGGPSPPLRPLRPLRPPTPTPPPPPPSVQRRRRQSAPAYDERGPAPMAARTSRRFPQRRPRSARRRPWNWHRRHRTPTAGRPVPLLAASSRNGRRRPQKVWSSGRALAPGCH